MLTGPQTLMAKGLTSGACIFLGPNLISWWSKKQTLVAKSSAEPEYRSLALAAYEVLWIQSLLQELKIILPPPVIFCDKQSTLALSHYPVLHSRTKHMELDIFIVREKVLNKSLIVEYVPFSGLGCRHPHQAPTKCQFCFLRDKLRVSAELKGGIHNLQIPKSESMSSLKSIIQNEQIYERLKLKKDQKYIFLCFWDQEHMVYVKGRKRY